MEEIWRPVVGFETFYAVSNLGRVKRTARAPHTQPGRIKVPYIDKRGYCIVHLCANSVHAHKKIHRLVMEAFEGIHPESHTVNHKNGIKADNRWPENLEYLSQQDNCRHAAETGLTLKGSRSPLAKITEADVIAIRSSKENGVTIGKRYGINRQSVSQIRLGISWRHVI